VTLLFFGCAGTLEDAPRFADAGTDAAPAADGGCPDVPSAVFATSCATSGCHGAADKAQGLDLESPGVGARLAGACARGGGLLVDPASPKASVLYTKLGADPPFDARMPLGKPPLDDATVACVLQWIGAQQGAGHACGGASAPDAGVE
jgi:hypothetical protein